MSQENCKPIGDVIIDTSQVETMTPRELLDYCCSLDIYSEQYGQAITHALSVGIHLCEQTAKQVREGKFPNFALWNVANNYYSVVEQIQDMIQVHMSRIRSEI